MGEICGPLAPSDATPSKILLARPCKNNNCNEKVLSTGIYVAKLVIGNLLLRRGLHFEQSFFNPPKITLKVDRKNGTYLYRIEQTSRKGFMQ